MKKISPCEPQFYYVLNYIGIVSMLVLCIFPVGAPPKEFLEQPITSSDHPFLKANVESIKAHKMKQLTAKGRVYSVAHSNHLLAPTT